MNEEDYEKARQQLQINMAQKQSVQLQYNEAKRTLDEIDKTKEGEDLFELVGQILIKKDKKSVVDELKEKIDILEYRLKALNKAVEENTAQLQEIQKELEKKK